jgi:hypothetical protein
MSCLFESFSHFVNMQTDDVRQGICDFLETNPKLTDDLSAEDIVKFESDTTLKKYIKKMRQVSTMGGATEIKAFCIIFKKNIKIKSEPNDKIIEFIVNNEYPFLHLRWTGNHYDAITPT